MEDIIHLMSSCIMNCFELQWSIYYKHDTEMHTLLCAAAGGTHLDTILIQYFLSFIKQDCGVLNYTLPSPEQLKVLRFVHIIGI
jgi:hypothetical protein